MIILVTELAAAVLAVNVEKLLGKQVEIKLSLSVFLTDSQMVLKYIANERILSETLFWPTGSLIQVKPNKATLAPY